MQLVYAWGAQCALPSLDQRISMVQYVLKILVSDEQVMNILLEAVSLQDSTRKTRTVEYESASFIFHPERFGSLPSVCLIPGTLTLMTFIR